ncbi:uncharacterized protein BO95DRAFT_459937 [Aspergillus brunneoviolaceus CBS 621.78]|uniref:Uncharacterized protein n=1 Tax=Aspergillus brunneoviolaceus CBS 621.78 TaxID=1450534 RepID=A0ACD1GJN1_9EURO|nr:hypothetical protein BO95DRAFT_459937 [Aspergillus brunneoviolaceus CBS 621.78]RAH49545.1 hypothetical protein BO95DRAFT_459937 [Aspergillus brunneoviolaceus CBS 621.78]
MPDNSNYPDERTPVPPSYSEFEEAMLEWADFMGERHGWFDFDPMQNYDFMAHTPAHIDPQLDRQQHPLNSPTAHAGRSSQVRERAGSTRNLRRQHYPSAGHVPGQQSPGAQVTSPRSRHTARPAFAAEHRDRCSCPPFCIPRSSFTANGKGRAGSTPSPVQCNWRGCGTRPTFNRPLDLWRHIKSLHLWPGSYRCPDEGCGELFNRNDNRHDHAMRMHRQ